MAQPIRNTPWFVVSLEASVDNQLLNLIFIVSNLKLNEQTMYILQVLFFKTMFVVMSQNKFLYNKQ